MSGESRAPPASAATRATRSGLAESPAVKLLFIGDVVGGIGRRTLASLLPGLRDEHRPDFVVVNGENAAGGVGITEKTARELLELGADAITLGNHAYRHRDVYDYLDREETHRAARQLSEGAAPGAATPWSSATGCGSGW